jgi:hypothetical protein
MPSCPSILKASLERLGHGLGHACRGGMTTVGWGGPAGNERSFAQLVFRIGGHLDHSHDIAGSEQLCTDCSGALCAFREIKGAGRVYRAPQI